MQRVTVPSLALIRERLAVPGPPMTPKTLAILRRLLAVPGLDSGRPWWPRDVLPPLPRASRPQARAGRTGGLQALQRRGLVGRTADGRYYLTPAAVKEDLL